MEPKILLSEVELAEEDDLPDLHYPVWKDNEDERRDAGLYYEATST